MTPDEKHAIYMKGITEGQKHSTSSPETLMRLDRLDGDLKRMIEGFERHDSDERTQWNTIREIGATVQKLEVSSRLTLEQTTKTNGKVAEHERLIHNLEVSSIKEKEELKSDIQSLEVTAIKGEDGLRSDVQVLCEQFKTFNRRINRIEGMTWGVIITIIGAVITSIIEHITQ